MKRLGYKAPFLRWACPAALALYLWLVLVCFAVATDIRVTAAFLVFMGVVSSLLTLLLFRLYSFFLGVPHQGRRPEAHLHLPLCGGIAAVTLLIYSLYWLGQFPGGMSQDTLDQYAQVVSGSYDNWHPVLHTLLFFTLPLKLTGSFALVVFLQLVYFAAAAAYLCWVMLKNGVPRLFLLLFCLWLWLNPYLPSYLMYPWKDLALTIFSMVLVGHYIQIVLSRGAWLCKIPNLLAFALVTVISAYLRHNAILFVAPLVLIALFYSIRHRRAIFRLVSAILVLIALIQGLYALLDVKSPDKRILETVGLPATVWSAVMRSDPDALPEDTRLKLYEIASSYQYEHCYVEGSFNHLKWTAGVCTEVIDQMTYGEVLEITVQCFRYAPRISLRALAKLTEVVWGFQGESYWLATVPTNDYGVEARPAAFLAELVSQCCSFINSLGLVQTVMSAIGFFLLVLLSFGLYLLSRRRISILHTLPLVCYSFGTMLLLSGRDYRFFFPTLPLWIPLVFLMAKDKKSLPKK